MIMTETFIKFTPDSLTPSFISVTIADTTALLRMLYREIGCRSIESVYTSLDLQCDTPDRIIMVVDEEGLLKSGNRINPTASSIYRGGIVGSCIIGRQIERDGEPDFGGFATAAEAIKVASAAQYMTKTQGMPPWI